MDCTVLLQYATTAEADVDSSSVSFGHPDPPKLEMVEMEDCIVLVAYTNHTVSAQLVHPPTNHHSQQQRQPNTIVEVCMLHPDDHDQSHEQITCLAVVVLDEDYLQVLFPSTMMMTRSSSLMTGVVDAEETTQTTWSPQQQKRIIPQDHRNHPHKKAQRRLAVVFGTDQSRLYTVEMTVSTTNEYNKLERVYLQSRVEADSKSSLFQVFPTRMPDPVDQGNPFQPMGGVQSLSQFQNNNKNNNRACIWIVYGDATLIKIQAAALFPSVWQQAAYRNRSVEEMISSSSRDSKPLVRYHIQVPPMPKSLAGSSNSSNSSIIIAPLPKHFPSLMEPLGSVLGNVPLNHVREKSPTVQEVLVLGQDDDIVTFPTMAFYSSENHLEHCHHISTDRTTVDPTKKDSRAKKSVTQSLVGSAIGALRWTIRSPTRNVSSRADDKITDQNNSKHSTNSWKGDYSSHDNYNDDDDYRNHRNPQALDGNDDHHLDNQERVTSPFPSLYRRPIPLHSVREIHDSPRKIEQCAVDPEGRFAATSDGLGRVLLVDLRSRQIIRMWKGCRDSSCHWMQSRIDTDVSSRPVLYLVIHCRQRRVIEVWRAPLGPRVHFQTQIHRDACVLTARSQATSLQTCYLLHSAVPGASKCQIEKLNIATSDAIAEDGASVTESVASTKKTIDSMSSRRATLRLQYLQQLLSASEVRYSKEDVRKALHEIKSLSDLATALDLLAKSSVLEDKLGVQGAELQRDAIAYCRDVLNNAIHRGFSGIDVARSNPHVQLLSRKIEYHVQLVKAFDALHKFELTKASGSSQQQARTPSHWTAEAMAWASTFEQVTGSGLDANTLKSAPKKLSFSEFSQNCCYPDLAFGRKKSQMKIYFTESSKRRRGILLHVFSPLLSDIFSFNVVYTVFDSLGIRSDTKILEQYFGEWFMTLSFREAYTKGLYSDSSPMMRLLQDLVARQLSAGFDENETALDVLHNFCESSEDLVRAFLLGALCLEAISNVVSQKEKRTYGKIQSLTIVDNWKHLLRKIRVCLLVSLRMYGRRLAAPITIENVNQPDIFTVFEWLARDELLMSHDHHEIISLEKACMISSYSFDPSLPEGDGPSRFKMLQNSCLSAAVNKNDRTGALVDFDDDDDKFGALLLFFKRFNDPSNLAAHRALLYAADWGSKPDQIVLLKNALVAIQSIQRNPELASLCAAVSLELWQRYVSPIYRALLCGFADVQEVTEEVIAPLLLDRDWLTSIGRITLQLLAILKGYEIRPNESINVEKTDAQGWPSVRPDFLLQRLIDNLSRPIDGSAVDAHSIVVCATVVSDDLEALIQCVPAILDFFVPLSLYNPSTSAPENVIELQQKYLDRAMYAFAKSYTGPSLDSFYLGEIGMLAKMWGFNLKQVHTRLLLTMYELGRDRVVDELLTKATSHIVPLRFVDEGLDIACQRLNVFLSGSGMASKSMRNVMGLLDASLCEWIKQRSSASKHLDHLELDVPIGSTHLLLMRLLSLSAGSDFEPTIRLKIHSLVVLCGILVKALSESSS